MKSRSGVQLFNTIFKNPVIYWHRIAKNGLEKGNLGFSQTGALICPVCGIVQECFKHVLMSNVPFLIIFLKGQGAFPPHPEHEEEVITPMD